MAWSESLQLMALLSVLVLRGDDLVTAAVQTKIVGGEKIDIVDAPWQVFLRSRTSVCGGSIISPQWVLTAAHCTDKTQPSEILIIVGTKSPRDGGKIYRIAEVINHKEYADDSVGSVNDISLLKTATEMDLDNRTTKAVTLPKLGAARPPVGDKLRVSGWGKTEDGQGSVFLRAVDVEVRDYRECQDYGGLDESTQICAGLYGKNSCDGDSGGPLVKDELLVGLVSYKDNVEACGVLPNVYTDVAAFRGWIKNHTGF